MDAFSPKVIDYVAKNKILGIKTVKNRQVWERARNEQEMKTAICEYKRLQVLNQMSKWQKRRNLKRKI